MYISRIKLELQRIYEDRSTNVLMQKWDSERTGLCHIEGWEFSHYFRYKTWVVLTLFRESQGWGTGCLTHACGGVIKPEKRLAHERLL